ncbi:hypothetical protein EYF80_065841 [Liparis tanakae]|uniref:Uncharacterized protein n=1 Tax=Liparis tanakae TaxID=230148 RepID=A0A4Z2E5N4_9TELE|nr:hypothetical protein EYF80_065841 [Liparis tanakae]
MFPLRVYRLNSACGVAPPQMAWHLVPRRAWPWPRPPPPPWTGAARREATCGGRGDVGVKELEGSHGIHVSKQWDETPKGVA